MKRLKNSNKLKRALKNQNNLQNYYFELSDVIIRLMLYGDLNLQLKVKFFVEFCNNKDRCDQYDIYGNLVEEGNFKKFDLNRRLLIKELPTKPTEVTTHQLLFDDTILARKKNLHYPFCFSKEESKKIEKTFKNLKENIYGLVQIAKSKENHTYVDRSSLKVGLKGLKDYEDYANSILATQHQRFIKRGDKEYEFYEHIRYLDDNCINDYQNIYKDDNPELDNKVEINTNNRSTKEEENIFEKLNETPLSDLDKINKLDNPSDKQNNKEIDSIFELL